jgi:hypothetical protein
MIEQIKIWVNNMIVPYDEVVMRKHKLDKYHQGRYDILREIERFIYLKSRETK